MSASVQVREQEAARRAWRGAGGPILVLMALVIAIVVFLLLSFSRQQDDDFSATTRHLVASALRGRAEGLAEMTLDYANWDDAYQAITVDWDAEWLANNYYSSVLDAVIVFRDGQTRYAWMADDLENESAAMVDAALGAADAIPNLDRLVLATTALEMDANAFVVFDNRLTLVGLAPITLEEDASRLALALGGAPADYIVNTQILCSADLARLGQALGLQGLRFTTQPAIPAGHVAWPVVGANNQILGHLLWRHERPGSAGLARMLWLVVLVLLIAGGCALWVARRLAASQIRSMAHAEAALESSRLKSEFVASVSHQLRTPLSTIIGYAEIIEEEAGADDPTLMKDVGHILTAARHLSRLVNNILDQSKIEAGKLALSLEPLDLSALLAEVIEVVEPIAQERGNSLTVIECENAQVTGDHARLSQCLLNLVGNAVKYTTNGNVTVELRCDVLDGRPMVVADITDTGVGISPEDLKNLFSPFAHADRAAYAAFAGSGLGLAISRKLARAMGGDIVVRSELGKGSTFSIFVPAALAELQLKAA